MAADGSNDDSGVIYGVFQQAESKFDDTHAIWVFRSFQFGR